MYNGKSKKEKKAGFWGWQTKHDFIAYGAQLFLKMKLLNILLLKEGNMLRVSNLRT